uniref:Uncharacterized protein n=1 Tax=Arundo donax TaxID=35708 RepID=A0A0A9B9Z0_ARUDO
MNNPSFSSRRWRLHVARLASHFHGDQLCPFLQWSILCVSIEMGIH